MNFISSLAPAKAEEESNTISPTVGTIGKGVVRAGRLQEGIAATSAGQVELPGLLAGQETAT